MSTRLVTTALSACAALLLLFPAAVGAQEATNTVAADAFVLKATVSPLQQDPIRVGPVPQVNVVMPPQTEGESDSVAELGPVPDDGALIEYLRGARVEGDGDVAAGTATATAETAALSLFAGQITADAVKAVSQTACPGPGDETTASAGSAFTNLQIGGQEIPATPEPNQIQIRLAQEDGTGLADIRVFEVIPDGDGLGWTTRMLHIFTLDPLTQAVNGEIIVAEAHTAATCAGAPGAGAGADNEIVIEQDVTPPAVNTGETVTYDVSIRNQGEQTCVIHQVTDRLPPSFTFIGASGQIGEVDGEQDGREVVFWNGEGWSLEPGESLDGTISATVDAGATPGVYTNVVIARTTCGVFTGVGAPVTVGALAAPGAVAGAQPGGQLAATGTGASVAALALLAAAGLTLLARRRVA